MSTNIVHENEYSEEMLYIRTWKKKLQDCDTQRAQLKEKLLDILNNTKLSAEARARCFENERIILLSNKHGQGFSWKPSSFFGFLARVLPAIFSKNLQPGSNLYRTLSEEPKFNNKLYKPADNQETTRIDNDDSFIESLFDRPSEAISDLVARCKDEQFDDVFFNRLYQARKRLTLPALQHMALMATRSNPKEFYAFFNKLYQNKSIQTQYGDEADNILIESMIQGLLLSNTISGNEITHIINDQTRILLSLALGFEPLTTPLSKILKSGMSLIEDWCKNNQNSCFRNLYLNGTSFSPSSTTKPYDNPFNILHDLYLIKAQEDKELHCLYIRALLVYLMLQTCAYPEINETRNALIGLVFKLGHQSRSFNLDAVNPKIHLDAKLDIASPARHRDGIIQSFVHAKHHAIELMLQYMAYPEDINSLLIATRKIPARDLENEQEREMMIVLFEHFYKSVGGQNKSLVNNIRHIVNNPIQWHEKDIINNDIKIENTKESLVDLWGHCQGCMAENKVCQEKELSKRLLTGIDHKLKRNEINGETLLTLNRLFLEIKDHYCSADLTLHFKSAFSNALIKLIKNQLNQCKSFNEWKNINNQFTQLKHLLTNELEKQLIKQLVSKGFLMLDDLLDDISSNDDVDACFDFLHQLTMYQNVLDKYEPYHEKTLKRACKIMPKVDKFTVDHQIQYDGPRLKAAKDYLDRLSDANSILTITSDIICACQAFDNALMHIENNPQWKSQANDVLNCLKPWITQELYQTFLDKLPTIKASNAGMFAGSLPNNDQNGIVSVKNKHHEPHA